MASYPIRAAMLRRMSKIVGGSPRGAMTLVASAVVLFALSAIWAALAYETSPQIAIALPVVAGIVALIVWKPMIGVYCGVLAIPLERLNIHAGGTADITPAKGLLFMTGLAAGGHLLLARRPQRLHPAFAAFVGLLLVMAVGLSVSSDAFITIKILAQWAAYLCLAIYVAEADTTQLARILGAIAVAGGIIGAIATLTSKAQHVVAGGTAATNRAQAGFQHPAVMAFLLVMALPPALALAFRARSGMRIALLCMAGLCLSGIMLSLTRGAILGAAFALLIMLFSAPFRRLAGGLVVLLLLFSAFNLSAIQHSPELRVIGQRLQSVTQTRATQDNQRVTIWAKTPAIIADHPFLGVGAGNFSTASSAYGIVDVAGIPFLHAHDVFLTIAAETGLVGLTLFLLLLASVAVPATRAILTRRSSPNFQYMLALIAGLGAILVCGVTDYPPSTLVIMAVVMIEIGAFVAVQRLDQVTGTDDVLRLAAGRASGMPLSGATAAPEGPGPSRR
ncbi:MAG: hypothetical protein NVSMB25_07720 [Thermoleophilaceae bacterium]